MSSAAGVAQTTNKNNLTNDQRDAVIAELLRGSSNGKIARGDFSRVLLEDYFNVDYFTPVEEV